MDMGFWPRLNKCCCCLSLQTGSLIIGYTSLFTSALSSSAVCLSLYKVIDYVNNHKDQPNPEGHTQEEMAKVAMSLYISHAYFLLVLLYYFVISVLLVVGVHRNKIALMRYYFNSAMLLLVLASALVIVTAVFFGVIATIPLLKWCVILFYCLIVVRSAYLEMDEKNKPPAYEMQNLYGPPAPQEIPMQSVYFAK